MEVQFVEVVRNQKQRLLPAFGALLAGKTNFFFDFLPRLLERIGEHCHVFVRAFDIIERRFLSVTQINLSGSDFSPIVI
jgi:hypothetical protein